jgi:hypothetical protein
MVMATTSYYYKIPTEAAATVTVYVCMSLCVCAMRPFQVFAILILKRAFVILFSRSAARSVA